MTINHIFQSGKTMGSSIEQTFIENIIIESISIYGFDIVYLPRTLGKFDPLFLEDTLSRFESKHTVEMYLESTTGFEGQDMMAKFGLQFNDSGTFVVAKRRWQDAVGSSGDTLLPSRPAEGDLLYFPNTKSLFEIKDVQAFDPFYQIGKLYVYKLKVELFQYSAEEINTGDPDLDTIRFPFGTMTEESYTMQDETGLDLLDESGSELISDDYNAKSYDNQSDNDYIQEANDNVLNFSVSNPFGEIIK